MLADPLFLAFLSFTFVFVATPGALPPPTSPMRHWPVSAVRRCWRRGPAR
jgi:hypothetical protein